MLTVSLIIVLLVLINSFYVAAEFAAVSVRRSKVQQLAGEGASLAARLLPIVEDSSRLDRYIAGCQIGITWSSLVLGAYSQAFVTPYVIPILQRWGDLSLAAVEPLAATGVLILMTTFQVVMGELIPKSVALQYPTRVALYTLPPMQASLVLYSWFLKILNGSGLAILKLLGFSQVGHRHIHSPEEIELLIAESRKGGLLEPEEHERLHRALRLISRPVRQLMVPGTDVVSIDAGATSEELVGLLTTSRYTRLPVRDGNADNIVGLLHTKDVVAYFLEHNRLPAIREVMRPLVRIPETVSADRLLSLFREKRTHQAAVIDEYTVVGLVTLGDLITELIGETSREAKAGQPRPTRLPDGRVRLPGLMRIDEVDRWIGMAIESPADTLGGHILHRMGRMPVTGERITIDGVELEVERVEANRIVSVLVLPVNPPEERPNG
jgi:CBS domain containing-hemolysin-like protein